MMCVLGERPHTPKNDPPLCYNVQLGIRVGCKSDNDTRDDCQWHWNRRRKIWEDNPKFSKGGMNEC